MKLKRREFIRVAAGTGAALGLGWSSVPAAATEFITRAIPSTGERLRVIGLGGRNYRTGPGWAPDTRGFHATIQAFHEHGGRLIDTSADYGESEKIIGDIVADLGIRDDLFLATKVDEEERRAGIAQMEDSLRRLRTDHVELMQVHNLHGWRDHLATLREWKQEGRIRYLGITVSSNRHYPEMERIMRREALDFIQVDYAIDERSAGERILPLAADRGCAVLINLPFGRGRLFRRVRGHELPDWAAEFDCASWAQFFLKYVVSHPAVTAAIPGMTEPGHAVDNLGAARGRLPDAATRQRMADYIDALPG